MMEAPISIRPFGFDRVFRFGSDTDDERAAAGAGAEALHLQLAAFEAQIEAMREERDAAVLAARTEGIERGLVQARGERAEALLAATDALHSALDDLGGQLAEVSERITRDAVEVALCAAEMLAGHALRQEPGRAIDEALGRALRQVTCGTMLLVRVHPESLEEVESPVAARRDREGGAPSITFIADEAIAPHDAHISWAEGGLVVDAAARRAAVVRELGALLGDHAA